MKKNKKVVIICAIIVAIIVISLIFALVYKGKTGKLPFEKTEDEINTVKMVENSTIKVTLGEVATTDDYMIIEYEVDIKDKNIEIENGYLDYVSFEIDRDIKIDGVICSNDQIASGALRACNERNILVPQNIAITGFGGVALSIITTPSLTTMIVPRYEEGYQAAALLFDRIDGQISSRKKVVLKPNLSIRDSTLKTAFKTMDLMFDE